MFVLAIIGIVLMYVGFGVTIYGVYQRVSVVAWVGRVGDALKDALHGRPTFFIEPVLLIVIGSVVFILGSIIVVVTLKKYSKRRYY